MMIIEQFVAAKQIGEAILVLEETVAGLQAAIAAGGQLSGNVVYVLPDGSTSSVRVPTMSAADSAGLFQGGIAICQAKITELKAALGPL